MKFRIQLAWMLLLVLSLTVCQAYASPIDTRRFYANTTLSWWPNSKDFSLFTKFIDESKQKGMNAISLDIPWSVEKADGSLDFSEFDARIGYVISQRLSVFVKLNMSTAGGQRPSWLKDDMLMVGTDSKMFTLPDGTVYASLAHPQVIRKIDKFTRAVAGHLYAKCKPYGSGEYPVVAVVPAFNSRMTVDYPTGGQVDYSAAAKDDYRKWARKSYSDIKKLNDAWRTSYKNWSEVTLSAAPATVKELYYSFTIKRAFDTAAVAARRANPFLEVALHTEASWEDPSSRSILTPYLGQYADWLIISDPPQANHAFTIDVVRTAAMGRKVATEIDAPIHINATNARYYNQAVRSFEHGAKALIASNWDLANVRNNKAWPFLHDVGKLARVRSSDPRPGIALYLSLWDLVNGVVKLSDYQAVYDRISENGKLPIDILTDPIIEAGPGRLASYSAIYLPANWTIPQKARTALKPYITKLKVSQPLAAGTLDEFGAHVEPLLGSVSAGNK